jgi:hypothetical protein
MHDDYKIMSEIMNEPVLWIAALVGCGPAVLIATLMIMSLAQSQPG